MTLALHVAGAREPLVTLPEPVRTVADEVHQVLFDLARSRRFVCAVRETDGAPASGVAVALFLPGEARVGATSSSRDRSPRKVVRTDRAGIAVFDGVESGSWLLGLLPLESTSGDAPSPAASPFAAYTIEVEMPESDGDIPVEFMLHRGLYIAGRVVAPGNDKLVLLVQATGGHFHASAMNQEVVDGKFRLGPLLPGRYTVTTYVFGRKGEASYAPSIPVQVEAGTADVELVLRPGGEVTLRAIDARTHEAVEAEFSYYLIGSDGGPGRTVGARGNFEAKSLEPGVYCALARASDGRVGLVERFLVNTSAPSEVSIAVAAGGTLAVRAAGDRGRRSVYVMRGEGVVDFLQLEDGLEARSILPPGHYRIGSVAWTYGGFAKTLSERFDTVREVQIRVGDVTILELEP